MFARMKRRRTGIALMLLNTVIWGAALVVVKPALSAITAYQFLFLRFIVAGVLTLPWLVGQMWQHPALRRHLFTITWLELIGTTLSLGLFYLGLARTSALEASFIATTAPVFITVGGIVFLRERQQRHEWWGLALALVGSGLIALEPALTGRSSTLFSGSLLGNALVMGQNIAVAVYYLLAKRLYRKLPKMFVTSVSFWIGAASFGALSWSQAPLTRSVLMEPTVILAVLYMAVLGSIIALTAYIAGQDRMEASEASLFTYLQPLVFVPLSVALLGDVITWPLLVGLALVVGGVFFAQKRTRAR